MNRDIFSCSNVANRDVLSSSALKHVFWVVFDKHNQSSYVLPIRFCFK